MLMSFLLWGGEGVILRKGNLLKIIFLLRKEKENQGTMQGTPGTPVYNPLSLGTHISYPLKG